MEHKDKRTCDNCGYNKICPDFRAEKPLCRYYISESFREQGLWDHNDTDLRDRLEYEQHINRTKARLWIVLDIIIIITIIGIGLYNIGLFQTLSKWFVTNIIPILPKILAVTQNICLFVISITTLGFLLQKTTWAVKTLRRGK